jgi:hypothetical protein
VQDAGDGQLDGRAAGTPVVQRHREHAALGAAALQSGDVAFETLHAYFLDRLVPACTQLLDAAAAAGEIRSDIEAFTLLRGVGNLCIGAENDPRYDARKLVELVIAGLRVAPPNR